MGRVDPHVGMRFLQRTQPVLAVPALPIIDGGEPLEKAQARRAPRRNVHLPVMEVGVAGVEDPAVVRPNGDAAMAAGMADERHEEDVVGDGPDALEAHPPIPLELMDHPMGFVGEMDRPVPALLLEGGPGHGRRVLVHMDVHRRVGEVGDPAGVVEIQVRGHQVAHVLRIESEGLHLCESGHRRIGVQADHHREPPAEAAAGMGEVVGAQTRVHEHEAVVGLDEKAVADHPPAGEQATLPVDEARARRAERAAVEMVHPGHRHRAYPKLGFVPRPVATVFAGLFGCGRRSATVGRMVRLTPWLAMVALVGCVSAVEPPEDDPPPDCPDGTVEAHGACVPRFDDCEILEIPVRGGGCAPVGVPPEACPDGFVSDGEGGCEAVLPPAPCEPGRMALPGDTACAPVAPCGDGRWGDVDVDEDTLYVDAAAEADGDGSAGQPLRTLSEALETASATGARRIAVAAGTYHEQVVLDRDVALHGRCPDLVEIVGPDTASTFALRLTGPAEVRGVSVTGTAGIEVTSAGARIAATRVHGTVAGAVTVLGDGDNAADLSMERVLIEETIRTGLTVRGAEAEVRDLEIRAVSPTFDQGRLGRGIQVFPATDDTPGVLRLTRGIVTATGQLGVVAMGSQAHLAQVLIRDLRGEAHGGWGWGVFALGDVDAQLPVSLTLDGVVVDGAREIAINVTYGAATLERTTVRDTVGRAFDGLGGAGLHVQLGDNAEQTSEVRIRDSAFVRSRAWGLYVLGGRLEAEGVLVLDTDAQEMDGRLGRGIEAVYHPPHGRMADVAVRRSLVAGSREAGITSFSSNLVVEATHVRDTRPGRDTGWFGVGIAVQSVSVPAPVPMTRVVDTVVTGSTQYGMGFFSGEASVEGGLVRDVGARAADGLFGDGILVGAMQVAGETLPAQVAVEGTAVAESERAGLSVFGARASLAGVRLQCNGIDLNAQTLFLDEPELRHPIDLEDLGDNVCGCTDSAITCQASSQSLEPSAPPAAP